MPFFGVVNEVFSERRLFVSSVTYMLAQLLYRFVPTNIHFNKLWLVEIPTRTLNARMSIILLLVCFMQSIFRRISHQRNFERSTTD